MNLQIRTTKKWEDPRCFSCITTVLRHHKEDINGNSYIARQAQQQGIQSHGNLQQQYLC